MVCVFSFWDSKPKPERSTWQVNLSSQITLKTQTMVLPTVTVKADKEDPAYTIMRKQLPKRTTTFNKLTIYTAKVYVKGKGKLTDYPWLAKKALEKEGITKDRLFISGIQ